MGKYNVEKRKAELDLQRNMALTLSKQYCLEKGLSYEKLKNQSFNFSDGTAWFMQPNDTVPEGLTNDMATMPKPTLVIKSINGGIVFEQTEYTRQYLS